LKIDDPFNTLKIHLLYIMTVAYDLTHRGLSTPQATAGQALEDRFEVLKDIGDGSFGSVVLARVRAAGSSVARRGTIVSMETLLLTRRN
jgi:meiosis induction protein kinase IME2/SME1